ncbi:PREDICTED: receptor-type tyrosine-protein phosphatase eta-like [Branchiostoma belcheri]|uniref:Receptor-type tyrosine-protein phosphatase eta-like n=1 Tax=Branchiostoma belcheri TaxID=7741 RepID=A0A6P4YTA5_BRABE|nr:PREDICTED: receptor-type tyrosine-protein phosphatase eta-like [Branchiostoma belcheri]
MNTALLHAELRLLLFAIYAVTAGNMTTAAATTGPPTAQTEPPTTSTEPPTTSIEPPTTPTEPPTTFYGPGGPTTTLVPIATTQLSTTATPGTTTRISIPNGPQSFTGETQGTTTIGLSWSPPDTANNATFAKYRITSTPSGGASQTTESSDPTATSTSLTGLSPGVLYSISLVAVSADDSVVSAEAAGGPLIVRTNPNAPEDFAVTTFTTTTIDLSWTLPDSANSATFAKYRMTYSANGFNQTEEISGTTATSTSLTGLSPGVLYSISLVAVSEEPSLTVSAEAAGGPLTVRTNPNAPEDFAVTTITTTTIGLNWTEPDSANNATFAKYRMTYVANGDSLTTEITNSSTTSTRLTGLSPGVLYTISLVAVSADDSVVSAEAAGGPLTVRTNPNAPEDFAVTTFTTTTIGLSWTVPDSTNGATFAKYRIIYIPSGGASQTTEISDPTATSTSLTGLSPGVLYSIRLVAVSAEPSLTVSAEAAGGPLTVRTNPNAPEDFTVTTFTTTTIDLSWTVPDSTNGAAFAKYRITYIPSGGASQIEEISDPTATSTSLTGLSPGVLYSISLLAVSEEPSLTVSAEAAGGPLTVRTSKFVRLCSTVDVSQVNLHVSYDSRV